MTIMKSFGQGTLRSKLRKFTGNSGKAFALSLSISLLLAVVTTTTVSALSVESSPTNNQTLAVATADTSAQDNTAAAESDQKIDLTCNDSPEVGWIMCPFLKGGVKLAGKVDNLINDLLTLDTSKIFNNAADNPYHKSWNTFRNAAVGLIIIAALVMVISQAVGVETMDAYTIRKVLPRLLFAAIFITLSWNVLKLLGEFSNDMGYGVRALIYAPFQGLSNNIGGGSGFVTSLLAGGYLVAIGALGGLALIGTAVLAGLIAFFILIFRQMLFILLVLAAPFAIACYILPNTQKVWGIWKSALISVLVVFPIISAFIAIGRVFAVTTTSTNGNPVYSIMAVVAYFAPYFLIPMAFSLAGGFIATVGGIANDRSRGAFDRLKNFRGQQPGKRLNQFKQGQLPGVFYSKTGVGRAINTAGRNVGYGTRGRLGLGAQGQARAALLEQDRIEQTLKSTPGLMNLANDDGSNLMMALSGGTSQGLGRAENYLRRQVDGDGNRLVSDDEIARRSASVRAVGLSHANSVAALSTVTKNKSRAVGAGDWGTLQESIDNLSGGNESMKNSLAYMAAFNSRNAGRLDLGGHWRDQSNPNNAKNMAIRQRLLNTSKAQDSEVISHMTMMDGLDRGGISALMNGHDNQYKQIGKTLDFYGKYGNDEEKFTTAVRTLELQKGLASGVISGSGQGEVVKYLQKALGTDYATKASPQSQNPVSIEKQIADKFGVNVDQMKAQARAYTYDDPRHYAQQQLQQPQQPPGPGAQPGP